MSFFSYIYDASILVLIKNLTINLTFISLKLIIIIHC